MAILLVSALAAALRFRELTGLPAGPGAAEAAGLGGLTWNPEGFLQAGPVFLLQSTLAALIPGSEVMLLRGMAALVGTLTVPALYLLGCELVAADPRFPRATLFLAPAVLAILRWHITFSRMGAPVVLAPLMVVLTAWAFWRAIRICTVSGWLNVGLLSGVSLYTGWPGTFIPAALGAMFLFVMIAEPTRFRGQRRGLLLAAAVLGVLAIPPVVMLLRQPSALLVSGSDSVTRDLGRTLAMFSFRGDPNPEHNVPGMPALDVLLSIPFALGLVLLARWRRPVSGGILAAGLAMLIPGILGGSAPDFLSSIGVVPVVSLVCGAGLAALYGSGTARTDAAPRAVPPRLQDSGVAAEEAARLMDRLSRVGRATVVAAILLGSAVYSTTVYFGIWARTRPPL